MKFSVLRKCEAHIITMFVALFVLSTNSPAHADFYVGGDWGGRDLLLADGDSLSGSFSNVGQLYIPVGALVTGGADNLTINAGRVLIDGVLSGLPVPGYGLNLSSQSDLTLNGSLNSWNNLWLSASSIAINGNIQLLAASNAIGDNNWLSAGLSILNGRISILDSTTFTSPQPVVLTQIISPVDLQAGSLELVPTPIPAAAWLLGSGLLGLAGIRRRQG